MRFCRLAPVLIFYGALTVSGCHDQRTGESSASPAAPRSALVLGPAVEHLAEPAREPMLAEHPGGRLFVTGYGGPVPRLWRSDDNGTTWTAVSVGSEAEGAIGNSDVDLAVAPDGTLYFLTMTFDRQKNEGTHIAVGTSRDAGATWAWTLLSQTRYDDRPWIDVTPEGTAHVIWNDGSGVAYAVSRDAGRTWTEQPRIHAEGGSSHMAVGAQGEIAVRITPLSASANVVHKGVDLIAVSTDGGSTWTKHPAPGDREWTFSSRRDDPMPRWVEPLAWSSSGALYSVWADPAGLSLARSTDRGANWTTWRIAEGGELRYFPYLVARGTGELGATWFSGVGDRIQAHVAHIEMPDGDGPPRVTASAPFSPDSWRRGEKPGTPRNRDTAGEYLPIAFLRDGGLAIVSTIQDDQAKRFGFSWRRIETQ